MLIRGPLLGMSQGVNHKDPQWLFSWNLETIYMYVEEIQLHTPQISCNEQMGIFKGEF